MSILDEPNETCHTIVSGGEGVGLPTGTVCITIGKDQKTLDVTVTAAEGYMLVKNQLWLGSSIKDVPTTAVGGAPDVDEFDHFACDFRGEKTHQFQVDVSIV